MAWRLMFSLFLILVLDLHSEPTNSPVLDFAATLPKAEKGDATAQAILGYCYSQGQGVKQDLSKAFDWFKKSAEQGNYNGEYNLGYCYEQGQGVDVDLAKADKWYGKAAEQGDYSAQADYAVFISRHAKIVNDDINAFAWFYVSNLNGNPDRSALDLTQSHLTPDQIAEGQHRALKHKTLRPPLPTKGPRFSGSVFSEALADGFLPQSQGPTGRWVLV